LATNINESFVPKINKIKDEVNNTAEDINTKHQEVVEKEALINPHYDAIENINENINVVNAVNENIEDINAVNLNKQNIDKAVENESSILVTAQNIEDIKTTAQNIEDIKSSVRNADTASQAAAVAVKAKEIVMGAVAALPEGTINDETVSNTDTYSSQEIEKKLANFSTGEIMCVGAAAMHDTNSFTVGATASQMI